MNKDISGRIETYTIGPADFTAKRLLIECAMPFGKKKDSSADKSSFSLEKAFELLSKLIFPEAPTRGKALDEAVSISPATQRYELAKLITTRALESAESCKTTCLITDTLRIIENRKLPYRNIRVYCFTDLEDTILSKMLKQNKSKEYWADFARRHAEDFENQYNRTESVKPNISITYWGVGRDEVNESPSLKKESLDRLTLFWRIFLAKTLSSKFNISNIDFYVDYPVE